MILFDTAFGFLARFGCSARGRDLGVGEELAPGWVLLSSLGHFNGGARFVDGARRSAVDGGFGNGGGIEECLGGGDRGGESFFLVHRPAAAAHGPPDK